MFYMTTIGGHFLTARLSYQRNPLRWPPTRASK